MFDLFDSFDLFKAEHLKLRFSPRSGRFFLKNRDKGIRSLQLVVNSYQWLRRTTRQRDNKYIVGAYAIRPILNKNNIKMNSLSIGTILHGGANIYTDKAR